MSDGGWEDFDRAAGYASKLERERDSLAARIKLLEDTLRVLRHEHMVVDEDCWYSCPKAGEDYCGDDDRTICLCGADKANALIDAVLASGEPPSP